MNPVAVAPMAKEPSNLSIQLTHAQDLQLRQLAARHRTSINALGQLAVRQLLAQTRSGAAPLIEPAFLEDAVPANGTLRTLERDPSTHQGHIFRDPACDLETPDCDR